VPNKPGPAEYYEQKRSKRFSGLLGHFPFPRQASFVRRKRRTKADQGSRNNTCSFNGLRGLCCPSSPAGPFYAAIPDNENTKTQRALFFQQSKLQCVFFVRSGEQTRTGRVVQKE
jgi:hypothetical protein